MNERERRCLACVLSHKGDPSMHFPKGVFFGLNIAEFAKKQTGVSDWGYTKCNPCSVCVPFLALLIHVDIIIIMIFYVATILASKMYILFLFCDTQETLYYNTSTV